ncbi:hypothetical protein PACTADRAFT_50551 [Pachysolen tannophilus NRRL Y-2460]|uniref:Uncharacterized protein n=1 Tax=Pachysolen tannophilus NRRL Y-2460 TaxID=669874 RepID=A0A1E4TSF5_PACTA|nr:hypothetical protein PACTADRAFT_50551 [Pachysolen tannophilus NRRL Y-2460]
MSRYPTLLNSSTFISLPSDDDEDFLMEELSVKGLVNVINNKIDNQLNKYLKICSYIRGLLLSVEGAKLSLKEILKIWEIRLLCLLFFSNNEPIELNLKNLKNEIILFKIDNVSILRKEVQLLIPELYKINKLRKQHGNSVSTDQFPSEVSISFKFLLLRLRYGPNISFINEYYNQLWILRSRYIQIDDDNEKIEINKSMENLSFSISSILIARQEYLTANNFIISIIFEIESSNNNNNNNNDNAIIGLKYISNLMLLSSIVSIMKINKEKQVQSPKILQSTSSFSKQDQDQDKDQEAQAQAQAFELTDKTSSDSSTVPTHYSKAFKLFTSIKDTYPFIKLIKVLTKTSAIYNDPSSFPLKPEEIGLTCEKGSSPEQVYTLNNFLKILTMVDDFLITGRILCSICAEFELANDYGEEEEEEEEEVDQITGQNIDQLLEKSLLKIQKNWWSNDSKYYGFE